MKCDWPNFESGMSIWPPSRFRKTDSSRLIRSSPSCPSRYDTLLHSFHHWCEFLTPTKRLRPWKHYCDFFGALHIVLEAASFRIVIRRLNPSSFLLSGSSALVIIDKQNDSITLFFARTKFRLSRESFSIVPGNIVRRSFCESSIVIGMQEAIDFSLLFFRERIRQQHGFFDHSDILCCRTAPSEWCFGFTKGISCSIGIDYGWTETRNFRIEEGFQ